MKKSEFFKNLFPLEDLFTKPDETQIQDTINYCDYTIEANKICREDDFAAKVNTADAVVFYKMGYGAAVLEISKRLVPVETTQQEESIPSCTCPICVSEMKGVVLTHYKCKKCNEYFTN